MKYISFFFISVVFFSCSSKVEKVKPIFSSISESIYASGSLKCLNQYQAIAPVSGTIKEIFVKEGDTLRKGTPILVISNEPQKLNHENAKLTAQFSDFGANSEKLHEAAVFIDLAKNKMKTDSAFFFRQKKLWEQQVGSKMDLEQKELAYQNSKASLISALLKYDDLKRQLNLNAQQTKNNLLIADKLESDYTLKSEMDGMIYTLYRSKGEAINQQTPLAVIGDAKQYVLEMQVDEYDIFKVNLGQKVLVTMDSYEGKVFDAYVSRISPMMNERSKSFLVEALFVEQPKKLYPNVSFEANLILNTKDKALLIPRDFLLHDSLVVLANGKKKLVKTGLKDFKKVEILSGMNPDDELIKPMP